MKVKRKKQNNSGRKSQPKEKRWFKFVTIGDGCWEWSGALVAGRYGCIAECGTPIRSVLAHRLSYEMFVGPIPDGLYACHRCDNTKCVRPSHLFLGTQLENMRDMVSKGRKPKTIRKKTHCFRGHEYSEQNTLKLKNGKRDCIECRKIRCDKRMFANADKSLLMETKGQ